jgi:sugar/nucleoside kinase (ribokinase family)
MLKPNRREATRATGLTDLTAAGRELCRRTQRPVIVTHGDRGIYLFELEGEQHIPAIPVTGPIDIVGAGDSAMAGLVATLCAVARWPSPRLWVIWSRPLRFSNWE